MVETRKIWLDAMLKIANPLLSALSEGKLMDKMPIKHDPLSHDRAEYTHLEGFGRTLMGIAPWLNNQCEDSEEENLRTYYADLSRKSIKNADDPDSPDCMNFERGYQPIVDAAFLAQAILRSLKSCLKN